MAEQGVITPVRFTLDTLDGEKFALRLRRYNQYAGPLHRHDGAVAADLEKVKRFPERKWLERADAWIIPPTEPNVSHLLASWTPAEYVLMDGARLLLSLYLATANVSDDAAAERHAFLESGAVPRVDNYLSSELFPPLPHQVVAFASARNAEFFALLMEMGTGKSKVVVDVICDRIRRLRATDPAAQFRVLIVAPKTVCGNWAGEFAKHATEDVHVVRLAGDKLKRVEGLVELRYDTTTPVLVGVVNYEGVPVLEEAAGDLFKQFGWDLVVCDESIWIKNPAAKRSLAVYRVGEWARSRFILTGLPITKNVEDLYGQFRFLKPGCLGYDNFGAFKHYYSEENFYGGASTYKKERLPELQARLTRFSFSIRRKQCVNLPEKQYVTRDIEMGKEQAAAYESMSNKFLVDLDALGDGKVLTGAEQIAAELATLGDGVPNRDRFSMASIILSQMIRLAQITSGYLPVGEPGAMTTHRFTPNPKLDAVVEYLEEIDDHDKVLVWSRFREDIEQVTAALAPYGAVAYYGGQTDKVREANLARFHADPTCRVFVANPQAAGFGINLVEATHAIYYANDFGLQTRAQSEDRNHRIGQNRSVLYVDLVVRNTIDELILEKIQAKKDLAELLTDRTQIMNALRAQLAARQQEAR